MDWLSNAVNSAINTANNVVNAVSNAISNAASAVNNAISSVVSSVSSAVSNAANSFGGGSGGSSGGWGGSGGLSDIGGSDDDSGGSSRAGSAPVQGPVLPPDIGDSDDDEGEDSDNPFIKALAEMGIDLEDTWSEGENISVDAEYLVQGAITFMGFITGYDAEDEEIDPITAMNNLFHLASGNAHFTGQAWETTPASVGLMSPDIGMGGGMSPATSNMLLEGDMTPEDEEVIFESQALTEEEVANSPELNVPTQEYLSQIFPEEEWNPDWTTEAEFNVFLISRIQDRYPGAAVGMLQGMSSDQLVQMYLAQVSSDYAVIEQEMSLGAGLEYPPNYVDLLPVAGDLFDEQRMLLGLSQEMQSTALEDEQVLIDLYGSPEAAREQLMIVMESTTQYLGQDMPEDAEDWSLLDLANAANDNILAVGDTAMALGSDGWSDAEWAAYSAYEQSIFSNTYNTPREISEKLTGTYEPADYNGLLFVASVLFEPVDWIVTGVEVVNDLSKGNWGSAALNTGLAIMPFVGGWMDDGLGAILRQADDGSWSGLIPFNGVPAQDWLPQNPSLQARWNLYPDLPQGAYLGDVRINPITGSTINGIQVSNNHNYFIQTQTFRSTVGVGNGRNVAFVEINIPGVGEPGSRRYAISGEDTGILDESGTTIGTVPAKSDRVFATAGIRTWDTEPKLLENIYPQLTSESSGTILLYTERVPCESCEPLIEAFQQKVDDLGADITVIVVYTTR